MIVSDLYFRLNKTAITNYIPKTKQIKCGLITTCFLVSDSTRSSIDSEPTPSVGSKTPLRHMAPTDKCCSV